MSVIDCAVMTEIHERWFNTRSTLMIGDLVLLAVAMLSVKGGYVAVQEPCNAERTASLVTAVA